MLLAEETSLQEEISSRDLQQHIIASARVPSIFVPDSTRITGFLNTMSLLIIERVCKHLQAKNRSKRI